MNSTCSLLIVDIFSKVGSYDIGKIHGFSIELSGNNCVSGIT